MSEIRGLGDKMGLVLGYADGIRLWSGEQIDLRSKEGQERGLVALDPSPFKDLERARRLLLMFLAQMNPPQTLLV